MAMDYLIITALEKDLVLVPNLWAVYILVTKLASTYLLAISSFATAKTTLSR
jgi:hypothetical protein